MSYFKRNLIISLILFSITFFIGLYSIINNQQFRFMGGMAEEYFELGINLDQLGRFHPDEDLAYVFRPPGYPCFIASVIKLRRVFSSHAVNVGQFFQAVYIAQSLLLSFAVVILFIWMSIYFSRVNAGFISLLFGLSPYFYVLIGLLHYEILHVFLTILSSFVLDWTLRHKKVSPYWLITAGALWGVATLVRPMTLILPAIILVLTFIYFRMNCKKTLKVTFLFTIGMILVIGPYTFRNYHLTNSFIPVNAQGGTALWVGSVIKLEKDPNHYNFWTLVYNKEVSVQQDEIWRELQLERINVTDYKSYERHFEIFLRNNTAIDHAYREKAIENIINQPKVYLANCIINFSTYNLDINSIFIDLFQAINHCTNFTSYSKRWLQKGIPSQCNPSPMSGNFKYFIYILSTLGVMGILIAIIQNNNFFLVPVFIYLCFGLAHAITYMDLMYYYIKIPFLYIFAGYFINFIQKYRIIIPIFDVKLSPSHIINGVLLLYSAYLTSAVIFKIV